MIASGAADRLAAVLTEDLPYAGRVIGLVGPPGSGRTTLARQVCARPEVVAAFNRIDWMSPGVPMAAPESLPWSDSPAAADLTRRIVRILPDGSEPVDSSLAVTELAGTAYGKLLVIDDVRSTRQRPHRNHNGSQLLITADESLLPAEAVIVRMEPFDRDRSIESLRSVYGMDPATADRLAARCGDRPLAITLAGRIFTRAYQRDHHRAGASAAVPSGGPQPIGDAVAALAALLPAATRRCLLVLGVFPPARDIPLEAVRRLWKLSRGDAHLICAELAGAGLIDYRPRDAVFRLHELVQPHLGAPHDEYLAAIDPGDGAWWELPGAPAYLTDGLARHLATAGRTEELNRLVTDLRWARRRIADAGAPALAVDLAVARAAGGETPAVVALARTLRAEARIFEGVRDPHALTALLASRLDGIPALRRSVESFTPQPPYLANRWPPPGRLGPALIRRTQVVFVEHSLNTVTVSPSGGVWTATADAFHGGAEITRWDPFTEVRRRFLLKGIHHAELLVATDESWLALNDALPGQSLIRLLDAVTGAPRAESPGHLMATGSAGRRLAIADHYGQVFVHDTATGARLMTVRAHHTPVIALALAPDESWVASADENGNVRITDARTGGRRREFAMPGTSMLVVAPNGEWLAAAGSRGVYLIDPAARTHRLLDPGDAGLRANVGEFQDILGGAEPRAIAGGAELELQAIVASGDGAWLAAAYEGLGVLVWDADGTLRQTLAPEPSAPKLAAAPDGAWLAVDDRFFDPATGDLIRCLRFPAAVAPDGSWMVTDISDGDIAILDLSLPPRGGKDLTRGDPAVAFALAADDSWLATGSHERHYWDPLTGRSIPPPAGRARPAPAPETPKLPAFVSRDHTDRVVDDRALSPDGRWLAVLSHRDEYGHRARQDPRIRVYNLEQPRPAASMPAPGVPRGCRWSGDGTALFVWGIGGLHGYSWNP